MAEEDPDDDDKASNSRVDGPMVDGDQFDENDPSFVMDSSVTENDAVKVNGQVHALPVQSNTSEEGGNHFEAV